MSRSQPVRNSSVWGKTFAFNLLLERKSTLTAQAIEAVAELFGANAEREFRRHNTPSEDQEEANTPQQLLLFQDEAQLTEETKSRYPHLEAPTIDPKFLADDAYRDILKGNIMFRARCASQLSREEALRLTRAQTASSFHTTRMEKKR